MNKHVFLSFGFMLEHDLRSYYRAKVKMNSDRILFDIFVFTLSDTLRNCDTLS